MSDGQPEIRLELYVRSLLPRGGCEHQQAVLDRLRGLADGGAIDAFEVTVWGRGFGPSAAAETDVGRELRELVETFSAWADERGLTLRPRFEPRPVRSRLADEEYDAVSFPAMALAAYRGDDLAFLAPCADDATTYAVRDVLDAFEAASEGSDRVDPGQLTVEGSQRTVPGSAGGRS